MEVDREKVEALVRSSKQLAKSTDTYIVAADALVETLEERVATLDQALAAAEAECAAARTALSPPPLQMAGPTDSIVLQPSPARRWADLRQAANANDATRERLGLGRIGEVAK
jgi:hypothetical protein